MLQSRLFAICSRLRMQPLRTNSNSYILLWYSTVHLSSCSVCLVASGVSVPHFVTAFSSVFVEVFWVVFQVFFPPPSQRGGSYYGHQNLSQLGGGQPGPSWVSSWVSSWVLSGVALQSEGTIVRAYSSQTNQQQFLLRLANLHTAETHFRESFLRTAAVEQGFQPPSFPHSSG